MGPAGLVTVALVSLAASSGPAGTDTVGAGVSVEPARVRAGMFFDGAVIHVSATVPPGLEVAVACIGDVHHLTLEKKGKAFGVIWMNVGEVSFGSVPDLYLLRTSTLLGDLAPRATLVALGVGYAALEDRASPGPGAEGLFGELVRLKERDGLWGLEEGSVAVHTDPAEGVVVTADIPLPAKTPPGTYRIQVYAFGGAGGELVAAADVVVRQEGLAAFISGLAARHGLLYGILAAVVAMAVGLLTGVAFGLRSRGGH